MHKKNYISREEHEIWQYIGEKEIIDAGLVSDIFPEMQESKRDKVLYGLHRKGYLRRARKGLYYNPERLRDFHTLALRIKGGYIGLSSALRHYNLIDYEDFTIFVMTRNFRKRVSLEGTQYEIRFIPLGKLFAGFGMADGLRVSSLEKTLFDCLLKPGLVGFASITKAFHSSKPDWRRFIGFFRLADNSALCQRTGYLLDMTRRVAGMRVPPFVFGYLRTKVKNPARLAPGKGKSVFDSTWKIQDNVGEETILSWWR